MAELEDTLGSGELTQWIAYYQIEPFGQWRDNYHAAIIASTTANTSGNIKEAKHPEDFILLHEKVREERDNMKRQRDTATTLAKLDALAKKS